MVELQNVTAGYMAETVLEDISVCFKKGELAGVFGPNGAGKTTLLCAVNGIARIFRGAAVIGGARLAAANGPLLRKKIGYVPQHFEIDSRAPVLAGEVALMGSYGKTGLLRRPGHIEKKRLGEIAGKLGITHLLEKPFGNLSGGEKQKTLIARAIIQEPEILLLDEIFAWIDGGMQKQIIEFIRELHFGRNLTTLIVSHNAGLVSRILTRIVYLEKGRIVFNGKPENFRMPTCCSN